MGMIFHHPWNDLLTAALIVFLALLVMDIHDGD
jgi:hypothetical protein